MENYRRYWTFSCPTHTLHTVVGCQLRRYQIDSTMLYHSLSLLFCVTKTRWGLQTHQTTNNSLNPRSDCELSSRRSTAMFLSHQCDCSSWKDNKIKILRYGLHDSILLQTVQNNGERSLHLLTCQKQNQWGRICSRLPVNVWMNDERNLCRLVSLSSH